MTEASIKPVKLAYICCEPEEITDTNLSPIILNHGITQSKERWKSVQQILANKTKRNVYAVDARNHGNSDKSDFFNFNVLAKDLEHFMETKNIQKAVIIGHSMGGYAAIGLALTAPEKVEKLVIEDVSPKAPLPELHYIFAEMITEQIKCFEQSTNTDTEGTMYQKLRESIYRTVPMIPDEDHEVIQCMPFPIKKTETGYKSLGNLKAIREAVQDPPVFICDFKDTYDGDALFIYGGQSTFCVYDDKDLIDTFFPKSQFCCFEDAGHEISTRHPEKFVQEIVKFL